MLKSLSLLEEIKNILEINITNELIYKYRIYMNLDSTLSIMLVSDINDAAAIIEDSFSHFNIKIFFEECISIEEYQTDEHLLNLFKEPIDFGFRKRLSNLMSQRQTSKVQSDIPIITFYSYKGGVGRTTSLVAFANYYAYHFKKNIVILDFDFEAPGLTNYFDFSLDNLQKNGVVEYLLDKQALKEKPNLRSEYMIEVSKQFTNEGSIYVMPSGNLYGEANLQSYLEGLARVDLNSTDSICEQVRDLIYDIEKDINPDMILIDSRTGFNDIFGFLSKEISNLVVGFFEDNVQTQPGLQIFMKEFYGQHTQIHVNTLIVNSLIHKTDKISKRFSTFKDNIDNMILEINDNNESMMSVPVVHLRMQNILANIGTSENDLEDYLDFIINMPSPEYKSFFETIIEIATSYNKMTPANVETQNQQQSKEELIDRKKKLLADLFKKFPDMYAENMTTYHETFFTHEFFFRKCMEDIFNYDKFILLGGKGTGKTAFYNALKNNSFLEHLKNKANKTQFKYVVIDIINLHEELNKTKYFEISSFDQSNIADPEFFYTRFWKIFILNSILQDQNKIAYKNQFFEVKTIANTALSKNIFEEYIYNEEKFIIVEKELESIEKYLKEKDLNLIITFDQLDFIAKPTLWDRAIAPLIKYCKANPYSKIQPKLFVRRDLFKKLSNLTNKESIETRAINLEWSKEEIFGFFFKTVFANVHDDFFFLMENYRDVSPSIITSIKKYIKKDNRYNQISLDNIYLEPLVETFFGKYANANDDDNTYYNKKYGSAYDWFYKNLMNSDRTISLRPFLDLIKFSIQVSIEGQYSKSKEKPILPSYYFVAKEARKRSVERHFKDLADEEGNEDFKIIIEYIKNTTSNFPRKLRKRVLKGTDYNDFLQHIVDNVSKQNNKSKEEIEEILKINGVISVEFLHGNYKKCSFSFLYKYFLGLEG